MWTSAWKLHRCLCGLDFWPASRDPGGTFIPPARHCCSSDSDLQRSQKQARMPLHRFRVGCSGTEPGCLLVHYLESAEVRSLLRPLFTVVLAVTAEVHELLRGNNSSNQISTCHAIIVRGAARLKESRNSDARTKRVWMPLTDLPQCLRCHMARLLRNLHLCAATFICSVRTA